jgi:hypothetical protein
MKIPSGKKEKSLLVIHMKAYFYPCPTKNPKLNSQSNRFVHPHSKTRLILIVERSYGTEFRGIRARRFFKGPYRFGRLIATPGKILLNHLRCSALSGYPSVPQEKRRRAKLSYGMHVMADK